jgi:hypothetical protein
MSFWQWFGCAARIAGLRCDAHFPFIPCFLEFTMTSIRKTTLCIAIVCLSLGAYAQTDAEHTQHHPEAPAKKAPKAAAKTDQMETMAGMEKQMNSMRDMHEKMMNANTPEEKNALMVDHMETMKDGMSMMGNMGMSGLGKTAKMPRDIATRQMMLEKRMDMMQSMMQMMVDRMPAPAIK